MSGTPQVTASDARLTVTWVVDVHIEPGSVPDRPLSYGRQAGAMYRPDRLHLEFMTTGTGNLLRPLNLTTARVSDRMRRDIRRSTLSLSGPKLGKDGTPGKNRHDERFYALHATVPGWAEELAAQALADLTADRP